MNNKTVKDLAEEAEQLMLHQFAHSKKIKSLIKVLVEPFQEISQQIDRFHHGGYIDDAQGETLDIIGDIVDFSRHGMEDDEYRLWLKVAILLNNGQGTAQSVFDILQALFGEKPQIQMDEYPPNLVMFTFFKSPHIPNKILFSIVRKAVPLGTKCQFVDASPGETKTFVLKQHMPVFQLDVSGFDESVFADFFKEEQI